MTHVNQKGETFDFPLKPKQKVTIGIDGQIAKEFEVDNYATCQIKWWLSLQSK